MWLSYSECTFKIKSVSHKRTNENDYYPHLCCAEFFRTDCSCYSSFLSEDLRSRQSSALRGQFQQAKSRRFQSGNVVILKPFFCNPLRSWATEGGTAAEGQTFFSKPGPARCSSFVTLITAAAFQRGTSSLESPTAARVLRAANAHGLRKPQHQL